VSENTTDLIIQLDTGECVILGTSDKNALATSFSQSVYPLNLDRFIFKTVASRAEREKKREGDH